jgi:hypothetical protein
MVSCVENVDALRAGWANPKALRGAIYLIVVAFDRHEHSGVVTRFVSR